MKKQKKNIPPKLLCVLRCFIFILLSIGGSFALTFLVHGRLNVGIACVVYEIVLTSFFLMVVERNKRSFFAKGTGFYNITRGLVWGLVLPLYPVLIDYGFGSMMFTRVHNGFPEQVLNVLNGTVFIVLLSFGYIRTMVAEFFGEIKADIASAVLFLLGIEVFLYHSMGRLILTGFNPFEVMNFAAILLIILGAVLMIHAYGDIRSVLVFLPLMFMIQQTLVHFFSITHAGIILNNGFMLMRTLPFLLSVILVDMVVFLRAFTDDRDPKA